MPDEQNARPLPEQNDRTRPFFEGVRRGTLMIQRCRRCRTHQLPARFACDECLSGELEWVEASGRGKIFSFVLVHQRYHPAFETPYNVTLVELDEGPRLVSSVVGIADEEIKVGMPVEVEFESVTEEISLPRFSPARGEDSWRGEGDT